MPGVFWVSLIKFPRGNPSLLLHIGQVQRPLKLLGILHMWLQQLLDQDWCSRWRKKRVDAKVLQYNTKINYSGFCHVLPRMHRPISWWEQALGCAFLKLVKQELLQIPCFYRTYTTALLISEPKPLTFKYNLKFQYSKCKLTKFFWMFYQIQTLVFCCIATPGYLVRVFLLICPCGGKKRKTQTIPKRTSKQTLL